MPLTKQVKNILYKPLVNTTLENYKYWVYVKSNNKSGFKRIGFGNKNYEQYKDTIGFYKHMDHNDPIKREAYLKGAKRVKNLKGELTWKDKNSANYYSVKYLW
mgnify:CR=1 FL=1